MPINNHWLSPYMMEASAKASLPTTATAVCCSLNLNTEDEEAEAGGGGLPREPLFEKPLTPSDVGKLNRLVIPKQHAERHFPLNGGDSGGGGGEKGLLLGFEDEVGKSWRFRYSYWNSSQSYVLTKGWSRFVKEKRLDAGDIVLFARHPKDAGRLFIGWRRRGGGEGGIPQPPCGGGWSGLLYAAQPYPTHSSNSVFYQTHAKNDGRETKNGNSKRLRLFGVNLEWDDDESDPKVSSHDRANEEHYSSHGRSIIVEITRSKYKDLNLGVDQNMIEILMLWLPPYRKDIIRRKSNFKSEDVFELLIGASFRSLFLSVLAKCFQIIRVS